MQLVEQWKRVVFLAVVGLMGSLPMFAANPMAVRPTARISAKVDNRVRTTLHGMMPAAIKTAQDLGRVDASTPMNKMMMVLGATEEQEQGLRTLIDQQNEKASPYYHQWITPAQFGTSFGASDADIATITNWLQSQGLTVDQVMSGKRLIQFSGTVGQVETAFQTEVHSYKVNGVNHISINSDLSIPTALASVVRGVPTVHDFFKKSFMTPTTQVTIPTASLPGLNKGAVASAIAKPEFTSGSTHYFGPIDFQSVYNTKPLINAGITGAGQTIGVVGRTAIGLNDVQIYRTMFGLPNNDPTLTLVGEDPGVVGGDDGESYLDVEVSGGVAVGANVNFVYSKPTLVTDGVDLAAIYMVENNNVDIITESYGQCEAAFAGSNYFQYYADIWGQAAAQGISVFVSAGDNGPAGCDSPSLTYSSQGYAVSLLASSPYNVAVGGTIFAEGSGTYWATTNGTGYGSALGYIPETPWNEAKGSGAVSAADLWSGSGGVSAYFQTPSWQRGPGVPTTDPAYAGTGAISSPSTPYTTGPHRYLPDVSLNAASNHDGTLYCAEGLCALTSGGALANAGIVGGTSVAAPEMAGVQALINQANGGRQGNPNFHYYSIAIANKTAALPCTSSSIPNAGCGFNDIATGNNLICANSSCTTANKIGWTAAAGYDEATGLGSVNAYQLATQWSTVSFASSTTAMTLSPAAGIVHGQTVTISIQVAPGTGSGTPTGQVAIFASTGSLSNPVNADGSGGFANQPAYCNLSGGACTVSLGSLPAGSYNVFARYGGDITYGSSTSAAVPVNIGKEAAAVTFAVDSLNCTSGAISPISTAPYGSPIYLDTTITGVSGQGIATGTISLLDGVSTFKTAPLNGAGTSQLVAGAITSTYCYYGYAVSNTPSVTGGTHSFSVTYPGDSNFTSGVSSTYSFTVTPVALTTVFSATSTSITSGASDSLVFRMTPLDATAQPLAPTGLVTFKDTTTGATLGTATPTPGFYNGANYYTATLATTALTAAGAHSITATYAGDGNYASVTPSAVTVTVSAGLSNVTGSTITYTANPGTVGVANTITFTLTYSGTAPTGTAYFYDGTTLMGTGTVTAAKATLAGRTILTGGTHSISAVYSGSATYNTYTSPVSVLTVNKSAATSPTLTVKYNNVLGSSATATVSMTLAGAAYIPTTGTVQFYDNSVAIGAPQPLTTVTTAAGGYGIYEAYLTTGALTTGSHVISAIFTDPSFSATFNTQTLTITAATPALTVSAPSSVYALGAAIPFTATMTVPAGAPAPTGSVTFYDGASSLGSGVLVSGGGTTYVATFSTSALASGAHSITAGYGGDTNYLTVTSAAIPETITTGNIWVANGTGSVSALTTSGAALTPSAISGGGKAVAIDGTGNIWSLGSSSVAEFSKTGAVISSGYTAGGINAPTALAIDGAGYVWVTNGNNTLSVLSSTGTAVSSVPYTSILSTPSTINVDGSGNLWITNAGDNSVTEVIGVATPVMTPQATAVKNNTLAARP